MTALPQDEPSDEALDEIAEAEGFSVETPSFLDPLEDLLAECEAAGPARKRTKRPEVEAPRTFSSQFSDPERWERKRGVALIHAETETLLGNFSEYVHRSVPGARKLIREEAPLLVSATERVSGSWWLGDSRKPEPRQAWHTQRNALIHLHLPSLGVHAPLVEVTAFLSYGGIARVELTSPTRFADDHGQVLLDLPQGTNVLDAMSLDGKIALRGEVGL